MISSTSILLIGTPYGQTDRGTYHFVFPDTQNFVDTATVCNQIIHVLIDVHTYIHSKIKMIPTFSPCPYYYLMWNSRGEERLNLPDSQCSYSLISSLLLFPSWDLIHLTPYIYGYIQESSNFRHE